MVSKSLSISSNISELANILMNHDEPEIKEQINVLMIMLQKKCYQSALAELKQIEDLRAKSIISEKEYNSQKERLDALISDYEPKAVPFMTEAAQAINVSIIKNELKELSSYEAKDMTKKSATDKLKVPDKLWIRKRMTSIISFHPEVVPVKKLKKQNIDVKEFNKLSGAKISEDGKKAKCVKYMNDSGKVVAVYCKQSSGVIVKATASDKLAKTYYTCWLTSVVGGMGGAFKADTISLLKGLWKKEQQKTGKAVKEHVMEIADKNHGDISYLIESVTEAVDEGYIGPSVAKTYIDYTSAMYEKETLLNSLESK